MDFPRPPKWKRILKKATLALTVFFVVAAVTGFLVQHHRDADFRAKHPAPGSFVAVDGHRMHFRQSGDGDFTFVLEAGLGDYSGSWGELEPALAKIGRVFVYDRAGLGWSEASSSPRTAQQIAAELHQTLKNACVRGPYILVGHSLAGVSQVRYAMDYPGDVAGLLLIDPSHKDQFKRLPAPPFIFTTLLPLITRLAPFGLPQLLAGSTDPVQNLSSHVQASGAELRAFVAIAETWGDRPLDLGHTPITVLTAGSAQIFPGETEAENAAARTTWKTLHDELVASSSSEIRQHVVVEGATHYIHRTHLPSVVDAARELVDRLRTQPPRRQ